MSADTVTLPNVQIQGNLSVAGNMPTYSRSSLELNVSQILPLPFHIWRVWDAVATSLQATSSSDDLGYYTGTHGTSGSYIGTSDMKTLGAVTRYARCLTILPPEYAAAESICLRFSAGMITHIADTTATLNPDVRKVSRAGTVGSNLYGGGGLSINSLTFNEILLPITSGALAPGDMLDIKVALAVNDAASATAVIGAWYAAELLTSIRG